VDETFTGHLSRAAGVAPLLRGTHPQALTSWRPVRDFTSTADELYRAYLPRVGQEVDEWPTLSMGDVTYQDRPGDLHLAAIARRATRPSTSGATQARPSHSA
jgi:hypothetical protein